MLASIDCPRCKAENSAEQDFCQKCGFGLQQTDVLTSEEEREEASSLIGSTIGSKYRVVSILGEGGFGTVYRVEQKLLGEKKTFALKLLHDGLSRDDHFRSRFVREASIAMELVHPNAVAVRDFGETEDGRLYFTMDYCAGESLKEAINRDGMITINRAIRVVVQLLEVLEVSHDQQIIHRDLKPENIFLDRVNGNHERIRVGDFGLARSFSHDFSGSDITKGGIVGTPRYMSPEQSKGKPLDGRSDLYSVGVIFFEMIAGDLPPRAEVLSGSRAEVVEKLYESLPERLVVPRAVMDVIARALAPKSTDRYPTASEFREDVQRLPTYTPTYVEPSDFAIPSHRRFSLSGLSTMVLILVIALVAWLFSPFGEEALGQVASWLETKTKESDPPEDVSNPSDSGADSSSSREQGSHEIASSRPEVKNNESTPPAKSNVAEPESTKPETAPEPTQPAPEDWGTLADWLPYRLGDELRFEIKRFDNTSGGLEESIVEYDVQSITEHYLVVRDASRRWRWKIDDETGAFTETFEGAIDSREWPLLLWNVEEQRPLESWQFGDVKYEAHFDPALPDRIEVLETRDREFRDDGAQSYWERYFVYVRGEGLVRLEAREVHLSQKGGVPEKIIRLRLQRL